MVSYDKNRRILSGGCVCVCLPGIGFENRMPGKVSLCHLIILMARSEKKLEEEKDECVLVGQKRQPFLNENQANQESPNRQLCPPGIGLFHLDFSMAISKKTTLNGGFISLVFRSCIFFYISVPFVCFSFHLSFFPLPFNVFRLPCSNWILVILLLGSCR